MRRKEERSKYKVKQTTRQSNIAHPRLSLFLRKMSVGLEPTPLYTLDSTLPAEQHVYILYEYVSKCVDNVHIRYNRLRKALSLECYCCILYIGNKPITTRVINHALKLLPSNSLLCRICWLLTARKTLTNFQIL